MKARTVFCAIAMIAMAGFALVSPRNVEAEPGKRPSIQCPDGCGMPMSTVKDARHPVKIVFQGKTFYCCDWCRFQRAAKSLAANPNKPIECPDKCGMRMSFKRDKAHPVKITLQGRTVYCCTWCKFSKNAQKLVNRK